ncbi:hypothetical protein [Actinoplanes aureus]|uniref:hypothetical protein n=1 Tax=Actinoplanes aureus TaxID=2792083 RepID=UPI0018C1D2FB|nr:hypothetical protein [Actinoplanes aureus]
MLEEQSAGGYRACGQTAEAVRILEDKIKATGEHLRRDHGHLLAKLANTVLATKEPEPDRAIALGLRSATAAALTGSARIGKELRTLDSVLAVRFPTAPGRRRAERDGWQRPTRTGCGRRGSGRTCKDRRPSAFGVGSVGLGRQG